MPNRYNLRLFIHIIATARCPEGYFLSGSQCNLSGSQCNQKMTLSFTEKPLRAAEAVYTKSVDYKLAST